uniref:Small ribosomal subunit protein uS3 C-terminal domain-containing protein n=1 Tax=Solanum lycopersicum TaxID=4081 RepID=A0A3Q7EW33_SOLLC
MIFKEWGWGCPGTIPRSIEEIMFEPHGIIDKGNRDDDRDHTEKQKKSYGTNTNTLIESVKFKSIYQSASPIAQDISFQPRDKTRSFHSIFSQIMKDIPLIIKKGVEGIYICCSCQLEGAEIAITEWGTYGKAFRNVFNKKIDYAPAKVSTRYEILGVKAWISYLKKMGGTCYIRNVNNIVNIVKADVVGVANRM